jgi:hypothetical protein
MGSRANQASAPPCYFWETKNEIKEKEKISIIKIRNIFKNDSSILNTLP